MKLIPSIGFSDFSGSAGSVTARKVGNRTYLSTRIKQPKKKTPSQAKSRCRFADTVRSFSRITEKQRQGWIALAKNLGTYNTSSGSTSVTGQNLFVSTNTYRKMCRKLLIAEAPKELKPSRYIQFGDFWLGPDYIVFTGIKGRENPDEVLYISMYPALSPANTGCWSKSVFVTVCPSTDWGDIDLTEAYKKKFGTSLKLGQKIFISICWLDSECGYIKEFTRFEYKAQQLSFLTNAVYRPRAQISIDQITTLTPSAECESFDYELSPIYKMTSNSITIRHLSGYYTSYEFPHSGLAYHFNVERSFQYARASEEHNLKIMYVEVLVQNNTKKTVFFNKRAATSARYFVTFGTYFVKS